MEHEQLNQMEHVSTPLWLHHLSTKRYSFIDISSALVKTRNHRYRSMTNSHVKTKR